MPVDTDAGPGAEDDRPGAGDSGRTYTRRPAGSRRSRADPGPLSGRRTARDSRGATPVAGKALEAAVLVLYVALLSAVLYGGVVPDYGDATAAELGDRVLSAAAGRVEAAVPPDATRARADLRVDLPATIRGHTYRVSAARDGSLTLVHPHPAVGGSTGLALPPRVANVTGTWASDRPAVLRVRGNRTAVRLTLRSGSPARGAGT